MQSLTSKAQQLERNINIFLRAVHVDELSQSEKHNVQQIRLALSEIRLDVRDYEYSETRVEQQKWAKLGRHNMRALNTLLIRLDVIFGPADIAELSAYVDDIRSKLV